MSADDFHDLDAVVDTVRYPIADLDCAITTEIIESARVSLASAGVVALPGFLRDKVIAEVASYATAEKHSANLQDATGTAYLGAVDTSYPEGHPRRNAQHSRTWVFDYDLVPSHNPVRRLFEFDGLTEFISAILGRTPLFRMADPLGALNLTLMEDDHVQGWHYDSTDFVVSLAIQSSDCGGEFECARDIRHAEEENYESVARVLSGEAGDLVSVYPMTPGTLMVFMGRNSLHRVAPVIGTTPRIVALLGYDTKPDTQSSDGLKLMRYGRTTTRSVA